MQAVCALTDLPDGSTREVRAGGHAIVLINRGGVIRAFRNRCPHWGIELNFQPNVFLDMDRQFIQCANHGALFDTDTGFCLQGPCHGESLTPVPLEIRDGQVWLRLSIN